MNKKFLFFTSAAIMCMACPAMAETFPQDGNMLENKTYTEAAVYDNTGVYEGTATANATYRDNEYYVSPGRYLPAASEDSATLCLAGSYCPGSPYTAIYYDPDNDQGIESCPANYNTSVAGSTANTQCYRSCATTDVAHSASVSGQMYYDGSEGDGENACSAETCVNGWHLKAGFALDPLSNPTNSAYGYINANNYFTVAGSQVSHTQNYYGITNSSELGIDMGSGVIIKSTYKLSNTAGTTDIQYSSSIPVETRETLGDGNGWYCWCKMIAYKLDENSSFETVDFPWVFLTNTNSGSSSDNAKIDKCRNGCATIARKENFRKAVFPSHLASCEANTINITWNDASAEDIAATGAATTVYEGDIKTPLKAVTKPGKTFVGWKFIKPQQ